MSNKKPKREIVKSYIPASLKKAFKRKLKKDGLTQTGVIEDLISKYCKRN